MKLEMKGNESMREPDKLDGYIIKNTLNINVDNLGELTNLIDDVQKKGMLLQESVSRLSQFNLKITFEQKDEEFPQ